MRIFSKNNEELSLEANVRELAWEMNEYYNFYPKKIKISSNY